MKQYDFRLEEIAVHGERECPALQFRQAKKSPAQNESGKSNRERKYNAQTRNL